jgi:hypothetical protein
MAPILLYGKTASVSNFLIELLYVEELPEIFSLRHHLTVFFASQIVHSSENQMGKTGMAVANGSFFPCMIDPGNVSMVDGFVDPLLPRR